MGQRIYAADDEQDILDVLEGFLTNAGYEVVTFPTGDQLYDEFQKRPADLVILDVMMPGLDGFETLSILREISQVPVIMLTAKSEEEDRIRGLELGADDYVTKPFSPRELMSRVKAVLRRSEGAGSSSGGNEDVIQVDDRLKIDFGKREVWVEGELVKLRPTEYRLLYHLVQNAGWVLTYDQILTKVWGYEYRDETHYVRLYINYLRQKLEKDPSNPEYILTERGVGYRFVDYKRRNAAR